MTLIDNINLVKEFHDVFKLTYETSPKADVGEKIISLRHRLMQEENDEYLDACNQKDIGLIADALGDQMYILFGTMIAHGLQDKIEEVFREIHRSNMSKLDENGQPIYREDGKILKSNNYFLPDITGVLERQ